MQIIISLYESILTFPDFLTPLVVTHSDTSFSLPECELWILQPTCVVVLEKACRDVVFVALRFKLWKSTKMRCNQAIYIWMYVYWRGDLLEIWEFIKMTLVYESLYVSWPLFLFFCSFVCLLHSIQFNSNLSQSSTCVGELLKLFWLWVKVFAYIIITFKYLALKEKKWWPVVLDSSLAVLI